MVITSVCFVFGLMRILVVNVSNGPCKGLHSIGRTLVGLRDQLKLVKCFEIKTVNMILLFLMLLGIMELQCSLKDYYSHSMET